MSTVEHWIVWLQAQASEQHLQLSLVGGAVRDQLLGRSTPDKDLDLVVEGPRAWAALELAEAVATSSCLPTGFQLLKLHTFAAFGTAQLQLQTPTGPLLCDLSSARREHYAFPGAHPSVEPANLDTDLCRRDFSLNAIAQRLPQRQQPLLDPFNGCQALEQRQLELLHPLSLSDDPTRLLRGVRYGARLGLKLAPRTHNQVQRTLAQWPWPQDAPALAARLRMELELLLGEQHWRQAITLLQHWGGLQLLQRHWHTLPAGSEAWLQRLGNWAPQLNADPSAASLRLLGLLQLAPSTSEQIIAMAERLQLPQRPLKLLQQSLALKQWLHSSPAERQQWQPSDWSAALEQQGAGSQPQLVLLQLGPGSQPWRRPLLRWLWRWRLIQSPVSAKELLAQGWSRGPQLGQELRRRRATALNQHP